MSQGLIVLFTDFGADDIYVAQMKAALLQRLPAGSAILDLLHRVPSFDVPAGAHLLAAAQAAFEPGSVFLAVVDPGVGGARDPVVVEADDKWYVGPDNGLLSVVAARSVVLRTWRIVWRPETLSASFHGRDLFAPIVAEIAAGQVPVAKLVATRALQVEFGPDDLATIIYIDHFGNALTGLRARGIGARATIEVRGLILRHAPVFAAAAPGAAFWYENSIGLVEIAVNHGSAAAQLQLTVGEPVRVLA